jgi:hypothetical protein
VDSAHAEAVQSGARRGGRPDSVSGRTLLMEPAFEIEITLKLRIKTRDGLRAGQGPGPAPQVITRF